MRKIIHIDLDAFFASVEQLDHPELRGKPVVVGGDPQGRGVVCAASYEARVYGIYSGMATAHAYERCPTAHFVAPRMGRYREISQAIQAIYSKVTDLVEPVSVDEAYLDVTKNHLNMPFAQDVAVWLRAQIRQEAGLTASAGIAPIKFVAKIASGLCKPDGWLVVPPQNLYRFISKLKVKQLWGAGKVTQQRLAQEGITTVIALRKYGRQALTARFGKLGSNLYDQACGIDPRPVSLPTPSKSRGAERTFARDLVCIEEMKDHLITQAKRIFALLVVQKRYAAGLTLKVRYHDFTTITRSYTRTFPFQNVKEVIKAAVFLLCYQTEAARVPVRLLGLSVHGLSEEPVRQLSLPFY